MCDLVNISPFKKNMARLLVMSLHANLGYKLKPDVLSNVHPEMVDFGFRQGPSEFSTAGIVRYVED
jgi:hypothetical protein